ncbi:hypothetical protein BCR43DRAFT_495831 [Syncephalastrum racemosum]|uniref:RING-type E3 ubiquitin transferase n=1 Tax=Syncephalastrum racemosum TaxID=13706 RepID=A0A1X2H6L1_SYNRA|nr:hypothetical protein BCR43DRAFT_495831 [Syncephalastrum racemosum]
MDSPENVQSVQRNAMNRSSFYMLLFLFSLLFLNFSEDDAARKGRPTIEALLDSYQTEKEVLNNVTFGHNLSHPLPSSVEHQVQQLHAIGKEAAPHYYHNITGVFRGDWSSQNVSVPASDPASNHTLQEEERGDFRFDGDGSFTLNLKSIATKDEGVHYIEGYMRLKDAEKSDYGALLLAEGVHFLSNGTLFLMGVPDGVPTSLEDLLHMLPSNRSMVQTRAVLNEQIDKRIEELKEIAAWGAQTVDDHDRPISVAFGCTFEMFFQLHPAPHDVKSAQLREYEKELESPQGITTIKPPRLALSSVMYSPNCGLSMSVQEAEGTKIEKYYSKAVSYAAMAAVAAVIQIFSLIQQMEYTPTPSSVSNVSYWTIAMQAMMDGYLCLLHLTTGVVIETVFMSFAAVAFFNFISVSVFGMRYLLVVWRIQRPEASRTTPEEPQQSPQQQQQAAPAAQRATTPGSILPLVNTPRPARPIATFSDPRRDISTLYYRLYALLLFGLFLFYQTATRSAFVQNVIVTILGFGLFSFWVPQIVRNVMRGCRRPLSWRYVVGMSTSRLLVPLYIYGCPHNLIAHEPSDWVYVLVLYVALQAFILFLQDLLGPRFFVPERYMPQTYNYHPIISPEDEESVQDGSAHHPKDCAICMLPVDTSAAGPPGLHVLGRAQYMVTPCQHLFHTECLEKWMRIKLECPVCRAYLPAC